MACATISGGYTIDCNKDSLGGLSEMKIAPKADIASYTETDGIITAITMVDTKKFYDFQLVKSTSSFSSAITANAQNGTSFYAETLNIIFNKLKASTSLLVDKLVKSSFVAIVKDRNGEYILLGRENGLDVTGGTVNSGVAGADRSGYELQATGEEAKISHVDPTIIAALLA